MDYALYTFYDAFKKHVTSLLKLKVFGQLMLVASEEGSGDFIMLQLLGQKDMLVSDDLTDPKYQYIY
jgi:hypothetical protein